MPVNKDAYARFRLIDERLRNKRLPPPGLQDLIDYVSDKLDRSVSKRTIQGDLQHMRESEELRFYAPISYDRFSESYRYTDPDYSITSIPVSEYELQGLEIAIGILKKFQKLPAIQQFEDAILRIADSLRISRERLEENGMIRLDAPPQYKGMEWIQFLAEAIREREILRIAYQSFKRDEPSEHLIEPYHLREYNNRFYLFARSLKVEEPGLRTFGLDRIVDIWPTSTHFDEKRFDEASYFRDAIGITITPGKPRRILLSFTPQQGKYLVAQPIHASQQVLAETAEEVRISLNLIINPELRMLLMSYGSKVRVLEPQELADVLRQEAQAMVDRYAAPLPATPRKPKSAQP